MPRDNHIVLVDQNGVHEAEATNARLDLCNLLLGVCPGVSGEWREGARRAHDDAAFPDKAHPCRPFELAPNSCRPPSHRKSPGLGVLPRGRGAASVTDRL